MRKLFFAVPLIVMTAACSDKDSLENQGQQAGAAADKAINGLEDRVDAEREDFKSRAEKVEDAARDVQKDIKAGLKKADNAVNAAADELKK